jgi:hypothetical protein
MPRTVRTAAVALVSLLATMPGPPAGATSDVVANFEVVRAVFIASGAVKATAEYSCPARYATGVFSDAIATVTQFVGDSTLERTRYFPDRISCDGTTRTMSLRFRPSDAAAFRPDVPLVVDMGFSAHRGDSTVFAGTAKTFAGGTAIARIEVRRVDLTDAGAVRVVGDYVCPRRYRIEVTTAQVSQFVGQEYRRKLKGFTRRVSCDGVEHRVAVSFRAASSGDAFQPDVVTAIQLEIDLSSRDVPGATASARDVEMRILRA